MVLSALTCANDVDSDDANDEATAAAANVEATAAANDVLL